MYILIVVYLGWMSNGATAHHIQFTTKEKCEAAMTTIAPTLNKKGRIHGFSYAAHCVEK